MSFMKSSFAACLRITAIAFLFSWSFVATPVFGDLFVSDSGQLGQSQILRFDQTTGAPLGAFASGGQLDGPVGMILDASGNLLVSNRNDGRILKYDVNSGAFLGNFYAGGGLAGPAQMVFGPNGNLFVANSLGTSISRMSSTGSLLEANFTKGTNPINPSSFAFSSTGDLFVGNFGGDGVLRYDSSGQFQGVFRSGITGASGLLFDSDGDLWLTSLYEHKVFELDSNGNIKTQFSTNFSTFDTFPAYLMFDPNNSNQLLVSLSGGAGVYKYSLSGTPLGIFAYGGPTHVPGQMLLVSAVPEPGAGLLLAGATVLFGTLRRRRS